MTSLIASQWHLASIGYLACIRDPASIRSFMVCIVSQLTLDRIHFRGCSLQGAKIETPKVVRERGIGTEEYPLPSQLMRGSGGES